MDEALADLGLVPPGPSINFLDAADVALRDGFVVAGARFGLDLDGELMNVQPEFADVVATARALGLPVKEVLARAGALARQVVAQ